MLIVEFWAPVPWVYFTGGCGCGCSDDLASQAGNRGPLNVNYPSSHLIEERPTRRRQQSVTLFL